MASDRASKSNSFLSVVMPVHDGSEWIAETLKSVACEPLGGVEIIVIDSSPTPATSAIVQSFASRLPLRLLQRTDLCPWQAKTNLAVDLATSDHVCILHQDDVWRPGRVAAVRRWIDNEPSAVLHLAPTELIDRRGKNVGRWTCPLPPGVMLSSEILLSRLLIQNFVSVPAPVFSRQAWIDCGGMDERLWYTPDWDIWLKLATTGKSIYRDEATTAFRIHGSSLTATGSRDTAAFRAQMEAVLNRHLSKVPLPLQQSVEPAARASIDINVDLASASAGNVRTLAHAAWRLLSLGPSGMRRYLRDSRLGERLLPRVRAKLSGAF